MNSKSIALLMAASCLLLSSCKKAGTVDYVDLDELPVVLKTFEESSKDRSGSHHSTTIMMKDFSFLVGTQEAKKKDDENWGYIFEGASRPSGFFVIPRMEWVETIEEVEAIIKADHKTGKGIPTSALTD